MSLQSTTAGAGASSSSPPSAANASSSSGAAGRSDGSRPNLTVDEMLSEDEARRRREQLNRRPSYRMILKDLETVGSHDKMSMKRELLDESGAVTGVGVDGTHRHQQQQAPSTIDQQQLLQPTTSGDVGGGGEDSRSGRVSIGRNSPYGASPLSNEGSLISSGGQNGGTGGGGAGGPSPLMLRSLGTPTIPTMDAASMLRSPSHQQQQHQQQMRNAAAEMLAASSAAAAAAAQRLNMIPSLPRNLLGGGGGGEMPSQPQPHMLTTANTSPMLSAVAAAAVANNLLIQPSGELINLGAKPGDGLHQFSQHGGVDWQTLAAYQQQHQQQQQQQQQNASNHNNSFMGSSMGLGNRQGSASLTSLSDNDTNDSNRKRQVRLLKNREAAKECRRKKKEYVKCLENRVAVLENQNKALIEELKTLKELYCQKEKSELS